MTTLNSVLNTVKSTSLDAVDTVKKKYSETAGYVKRNPTATKALGEISKAVSYLKKHTSTAAKHTATIAKYAGYLPFISTVTGFGRVAYGVEKLVEGHFDAKASKLSQATQDKTMFNARSHKEMKLGAQHLKRGLVEMIPVIGNVAVALHDEKPERFPVSLKV